MQPPWNILPWVGLVVGIVVAAWGGGNVRWAMMQRDRARERISWIYFVVGWVVLLVSVVGIASE